MSVTNQRILADNLKKSISNYEELTLPQYTSESLTEELIKGEKLFFTNKGLSDLRDNLQKAKNISDEDLANLPDFSKLQKIVINKGETIDFGYFLPIENKKTEETK